MRAEEQKSTIFPRTSPLRGVVYFLLKMGAIVLNECDSTVEAATVVGGLHAIARGLFAVAKAIDGLAAGREVRVKLTVADDDALAHAICMGLRHGLFGAHADEGTDVRDRS